MLKITSITRINPAPCRHWSIDITTPAGTETVKLHDTQLDDFIDAVKNLVPDGVSKAATLAVLWATWKMRSQGATVAQILNKDIDI